MYLQFTSAKRWPVRKGPGDDSNYWTDGETEAMQHSKSGTESRYSSLLEADLYTKPFFPRLRAVFLRAATLPPQKVPLVQMFLSLGDRGPLSPQDLP